MAFAEKYVALLSSACKTAGDNSVSRLSRLPQSVWSTLARENNHSTQFFFAVLSRSFRHSSLSSIQWKTTVGRIDGPDSFVLGDAWRLLKVQFHRASELPAICPVCLDSPKIGEWYVTKSCKHAVCRVSGGLDKSPPISNIVPCGRLNSSSSLRPPTCLPSICCIRDACEITPHR
jgi:hypothetical protein